MGQLLRLEEAGYVAVEKQFVLRQPPTLYRVTEAGRQALTEYVQAWRPLLGPSHRCVGEQPAFFRGAAIGVY